MELYKYTDFDKWYGNHFCAYLSPYISVSLLVVILQALVLSLCVGVHVNTQTEAGSTNVEASMLAFLVYTHSGFPYLQLLLPVEHFESQINKTSTWFCTKPASILIQVQ